MVPPVFDELDETDPAAIETAALEELGAILSKIGIETASERTGIDHERLTAIVEGSNPALDIGEVAALLAAADESDPETIRLEIQDRLLMGMTIAVLDVDTLAARCGLDLSGKEVHQKVEGRLPMTLVEFAHLAAVIADRR